MSETLEPRGAAPGKEVRHSAARLARYRPYQEEEAIR
jgi:hypothetical protein